MIIELPDGTLTFPMGQDAMLMVLPEERYQQATCCDNRMVAMIVQRGGRYSCTLCDSQEQERKRSTAIEECPYVID